MRTLISSEFYKITKDKWMITIVLLGICLPISFFVMSLNENIHEKIYFMGDFFPILICLVIGQIWALEYGNRTINDIFGSNHSRLTIYACKMLITLLVCLFLLFEYLAVLIIFGITLEQMVMFLCQGVLIFSQTLIMILIAVIVKSYSKVAMAGLIFLIFNRIANSMYESATFMRFTSNTFLALFYRAENLKSSVNYSKSVLYYIAVGLICLVVSLVVFIRREVK